MLFDISCNISDDMYKGLYNSKQKHQPDIVDVLKRCINYNVIPFFVGIDSETSKQVLTLAKQYNTYCYVGVHPNSVKDESVWNEVEMITEMVEKQKSIKNNNLKNENINIATTSQDIPRFYNKHIKNNIIALGEIGLDYYRSPDTACLQRKVLSTFLDLPHNTIFLHSRHSHRDIVEIMSDYKKKVVVHSFDGSVDEMRELIKLGFYIGINGCSVKREDSIDTVRELDVNRLLIESDAPYCGIGSSYAGYKFLNKNNELENVTLKNGLQEKLETDNILESNIRENHKTINKRLAFRNNLCFSKKYRSDCVFKGRNEPAMIMQVFDVVANIKEMELVELENILFQNMIDFFGTDVVNY